MKVMIFFIYGGRMDFVALVATEKKLGQLEKCCISVPVADTCLSISPKQNTMGKDNCCLASALQRFDDV